MRRTTQPLLIEAVAAALEDFEAPPVAAPCEPVDPASEEDFAPPVQLPEDMLAALADAA